MAVFAGWIWRFVRKIEQFQDFAGSIIEIMNKLSTYVTLPYPGFELGTFWLQVGKATN
jgi:hypothetical protein